MHASRANFNWDGGHALYADGGGHLARKNKFQYIILGLTLLTCSESGEQQVGQSIL